MEATYEETYIELSRLMMHVSRVHHRINMSAIRGLGIHPSEHFLLMRLDRMGNAGSQCQIAEELNITPASVARTVKSLDNGGYIRRNECAGDSRRNEIHITEKGRAVTEESRRMFSATDAKIFGGFSQEDLCALRGYLERMLQNVSALEQSVKMREEMDAN